MKLYYKLLNTNPNSIVFYNLIKKEKIILLSNLNLIIDFSIRII